MNENVEKLSVMARSLGVDGIANVVLLDPRFHFWSGCCKKGQHHYGEGGLAQHVWEVADLCLKNNNFFKAMGKGVNEQKLFLAAVFHDCGKMDDYEPISPNDYKEWQGTTHRRRVHHVYKSAIVWHKTKVARGFIDPEDDVLHAILSHHCLRDWGSPVGPNTRLAWLLHLCDNMSARMDDCLTWDLGKKVEPK